MIRLERELKLRINVFVAFWRLNPHFGLVGKRGTVWRPDGRQSVVDPLTMIPHAKPVFGGSLSLNLHQIGASQLQCAGCKVANLVDIRTDAVYQLVVLLRIEPTKNPPSPEEGLL